MPDSDDLESLESFVEKSRKDITAAVRFACWHHKYAATPQDIEDFTEQINLLLLADDCRKLRTYDPTQALFTTWLQPVVNHDVGRQIQKLRRTESLEEELLNRLHYAPTQEKELLRKEQRAILHAAIDKLSLHDQRIARLKLQDVPNEEVAQELNIKAASVGREWRVIKAKLVQIGTDGAQSKAKQSKAKQSKAKQSKAKQSKALTPFEIFASFFST